VAAFSLATEASTAARATVDDDARAFARERFGDRVSDARCAAADQRELAREFEIHVHPAVGNEVS
jgi:hypothetical protein